MDTLKACINVDRIGRKVLGPPLVDADWHAFCQAIYKGVEGREWEGLYFHYREMSTAAGARKTSESQKAKALWAMKAQDFYDPARKDNILGRNQTRLALWEEHLTEPMIALDKALKCVENPYQGLTVSSRHFVEVVNFNGLWPRGLRHGAKDVGQTAVGRCLALFGPVG